jgi:hypothetical protein
MKTVETDPILLANRAATFSEPATVIVDAPGVRVREGQVATVTVRIRPLPAPETTPTPPRKAKRG